MTEKISVIISVYNTKKYLKKCLESIIKDDYKELEILVIDDHSEESSFDLIEKINDKRIKYIYKEKNVGLSIIKQILRKVNMLFLLIVMIILKKIQ